MDEGFAKHLESTNNKDDVIEELCERMETIVDALGSVPTSCTTQVVEPELQREEVPEHVQDHTQNDDLNPHQIDPQDLPLDEYGEQTGQQDNDQDSRDQRT